MHLYPVICLTLLLSSPAFADTIELDKRIEQAQQLSRTAPAAESQPVIDSLLQELEQASPRQRVDIELLQVRNLTLQGRNEHAISRLEDLLDGPLDPDQRLAALRLAANIGFNIERYEFAFAHLTSGLQLLSRADNAAEESRLLSLAGFFHSITGNHDKAVDYASRAVAIIENGNLADQCESRQRLSVAYRRAGSVAEAEQTARRALQNCRESGNQIFLGTVELELGYLALDRRALEEAEQWVNQGLDRLRTAVWADGILTGEHLLARVSAARGQHEQTLTLVLDLIERVSERQLWERLAALHELAASSLVEIGDFEAAYLHMVEHAAANRRFLDQDRARRLAGLEVEFDTQRREQELALLREQQRVATLEEETRQQQRYFRRLAYAFGGFLMIILALLLIHALRDRRHYRRLAQLDSLTGLSNHTRFFDNARMMVEEAHHNRQPLVLGLADIDHFKQVNDQHGHLVGDEALREVASMLRDKFSGVGTIGRIGGEEFGILLPASTITQARQQVQVLRERLKRINYGVDGKPLTISFGLAQLGPGEPLEQLRQRADQVLYQAKHQGRDSVVVAEHPSNS